MAGLIWTAGTLDDVDEIAAFIAKDAPVQARRVVDLIHHTAGKLQDLPYLGQRVPELALEEIRELSVFRYRLIYQLLGDTAYIVAILHGARLFTAIEDRF